MALLRLMVGKPSEDRREIFIFVMVLKGTFKLWGTRDLHFYQVEQMNEVEKSVL